MSIPPLRMRFAIAGIACLVAGGVATVLLALGASASDGSHAGTSAARACRPAPAALIAPGCPVVFRDYGATQDADKRWGAIDCQSDRRHHVVRAGGDTTRTARGKPQGNRSYRRLRVIDGDDYFGERCELGHNEHRKCCDPNPALYREGQHRITFVSFWLPQDFRTEQRHWQVLLQMKQTQPSAAGGGVPALSIGLDGGEWSLVHAERERLWDTPAKAGRWVRVAINAVYSQDRDRGFVRLSIDLNEDGDARDPHEQSPGFRVPTLKRESTGGSSDGIAPGASIPSHLRVGMYHDTDYPCPAPDGCTIGVDNVQVVNVPR
jgi:Polysaccharide lyase